MKRSLIIKIMVLFLCTITVSSAVNIGAILGWGRYWRDEYGMAGFGGSVFSDINIVANFCLSPTINFWTGSDIENGYADNDLAPSLAFKYYLSSDRNVPFIGIEPKMHFIFENEMGYNESYNYNYFGVDGFGGININVKNDVYVPIQFNYGLIFGEDIRINVLSVKLGVLGKI